MNTTRPKVQKAFDQVRLSLLHSSTFMASTRPDMLPVSQVYAIIVLPNGGPDLEAYTFSQPTKAGWRQACSLFWQIVRALATAENLVSFEVRYLSRRSYLDIQHPFVAQRSSLGPDTRKGCPFESIRPRCAASYGPPSSWCPGHRN